MSRQGTSTVIAVVVLALAGAGAVLAARSGSDRSAAAPQPAASSTPPQRVVLPGRPGDAAVVSDSDRVKVPDGSTYNGIDVTFVQMMIVHHGQAIAMTELAAGRAADPALGKIAERIGAAQAPEVAWMKSWLSARKQPETDPSHDHDTMPGMQSDADMAALAAASGAAFDRKFAAMMIDHHSGAMQMCGDVVQGGTDEQLREVAGEMSVEQGSEINRIRALGV